MPVLITRDSVFVITQFPQYAMLCDITYIVGEFAYILFNKIISMLFYLNNTHIGIVCKQDILLSETY